MLIKNEVQNLLTLSNKQHLKKFGIITKIFIGKFEKGLLINM